MKCLYPSKCCINQTLCHGECYCDAGVCSLCIDNKNSHRFYFGNRLKRMNETPTETVVGSHNMIFTTNELQIISGALSCFSERDDIPEIVHIDLESARTKVKDALKNKVK